MNVNELFAQIFKRGQRYGSVVDKGTALARCCQLSSDDGVFRVVFYVVLAEKRFHLVS